MFEKPMIQIHGKTTLLMEFKSTIKVHGFKPMIIYLSESPILIGNI